MPRTNKIGRLWLTAGWLLLASGAGAQPRAAQPSQRTQPALVQPAPQPSQPAGSALPSETQPATPALKPAALTPADQTPATVKSVKIVHEKDGAAIEIMTSRPVPPALQTLANPPRLVIDLPNANAGKAQKHQGAKGEQFSAVHVDQFQVSPPVTRIVVDLTAPHQYTWDAAGNRVMIRQKPVEAKPAPPPPPPPAQPMTVNTLTAGAKPAVVPVTPRPSGSMVLAGSRIGSGSSVTAGAETAVLHIARGGEVHVCPGSTVSVTASKNGQELMLGMSTGGLETHYHVGDAADAVLTPDFRILLAGPGDFDYAFSTNARGDTCVRALLGNASAVIVSELMGDKTYQVKPTEQVVFHEGRVDLMSNEVPPECGCPPPPQPVMRAEGELPPISDAHVPANVQLPTATARSAMDPMLPPMSNPIHTGSSGPPGGTVNIASARPETTPLPPSKPNEVKVQIEAPLVFRGGGNAPSKTAGGQPAPAPKPGYQAARRDPAAPIPTQAPPPKAADPAPAAEPKPHRGFMGRVKGFFSAIFH